MAIDATIGGVGVNGSLAVGGQSMVFMGLCSVYLRASHPAALTDNLWFCLKD